MSDLHHLPLVGHDLPEYPVAKRPVRVFKVGPWWTWEHQCLHRPASTPAGGYPHDTREHAQMHALKHWRNC